MSDPNDPARHAYLAEGNARQARKRVATKVVIRDDGGQVLLVNPTYKSHWDLPGGMAEANEPPRSAAARGAAARGAEGSALDLVVPLGRLLLVEWVGPGGPWDDQLVFVFDGGLLAQEDIDRLTLNDPESSGFQFAPDDAAAARLLRPDVHQRLTHALEALGDGTTAYDEVERDRVD